MKISDKIGRIFALVIFSPTLFILSYRIKNCDIISSNTLLFLSILLFSYESFWIITKPYDIREFQ